MPKIIQNLPEKLIEETRRQVMEVGYTALNMREIARNCGVGIGTVYNYFPSKDALIAQFLLQDWKVSLERIHLSVRESSEAEAVCAAVAKYAKHYSVKSRNVTAGAVDLVLELRTAEGAALVKAVDALESVRSVSLMSHDGEVSF